MGLQHRPERRNPCACGDKNRIACRLTQRERPERRPHCDRVPGLHVEQLRGKQSVWNQIEAKLEPVSLAGSGGKRVSAGDLFAVDGLRERCKLARHEVQFLNIGNFKNKMPDIWGEFFGIDQRRSHLRSAAGGPSTGVSSTGVSIEPATRSSNASIIAGCPSSGAVTSISKPRCAFFASSIN